MPEFEKYKVKEYTHWSVSLHENQGYLGRAVIWCTREDAVDLQDATEEEILEFLEILKELKQAFNKAFSPDWFNYSFLGNTTRHLHAHFLPRYDAPRTFAGIIFEDKDPNNNWQTDRSFVTSPELLEKIKAALLEKL